MAQQILSQELLDKGYTPEEIELTKQNGNATITTAGLEPGTYYIASPGGWTEGKLGDVNNDTQVTSKDATIILQYVAKLITEFPAEKQ